MRAPEVNAFLRQARPRRARLSLAALVALGVALLGTVRESAAADLVVGGQPRADIVVAAAPPRMTALAATELQTYLLRITGARLPIVTTPGTNVPAHIFVGRSAATDLLGLDVSALRHDAFRLASGTNWLALLGLDTDFSPTPPYASSNGDIPRMLAEWDALTGQTWNNPRAGMYKRYNATLKLWEMDGRGSLNAVYEYLRGLGVRWYFPGPLGEVVPQTNTLALPATNAVVHPDFPLRHLYFYYNQFSMASADEVLWQLRLGLNSGREVLGLGSAGHGIVNVIARDEVKRAHPDYYALWGGVRATNAAAPCLSSPGLFTQNVAFARADFDTFGDPMISVAPSDGYMNLCECPLCAGKGSPERGYYGGLSDYVWGYVNRVATNLAVTHPGRIVQCIAYTSYQLPPTNIAVLGTNVGVILCRWRSTFHDPAIRSTYTNLVMQWLQKAPARELMIWDYYLHSARTVYSGVPVYYPRLIADDLRFLKGKSRGDFIEVARNYLPDGDTWHALAANHLNVYVTARFYWDADQDLDALLDDYYGKFYGPAAAHMKAFIEYSEAHWPTMRSDKAAMDQTLTLLEAARQAAGAGIYRQRIDLLTEYVKPLAALRDSLNPHYVARNGQTPVFPYLTWATAASNIQEAVDAANTNTLVWVGPGRYTACPASTNHLGTNVVFIRRPMTLRAASADPSATVIDGEGRHRGLAAVYSGATSNLFVLDGFTIANGFALNTGGGMLLDSGNYAWTAVVQNCVFRDNTVLSTNGSTLAAGGALYVYNTSSLFGILLSNCVVRSNQSTNSAVAARSLAGGLFLRNGGLKRLERCRIESNSAGRGAGLHTEHGTLQLESCHVRDNVAPYNENAIWGGGGLYLASSSLNARNCLLVGNLSAGSGGAVACQAQGGSGVVALENCTVADNRAVTGGGIYIRSWSAAQSYNPSFRMDNSIVWNNDGGNLSLAAPAPGYTHSATHSCFTPTNLPGPGNIPGPPGFDPAPGREYRLATNSPCIDAGAPAPWMATGTDLDGHARIVGRGVDIGACESGDPFIIEHPLSLEVNPGAEARFAVSAGGEPPLVYQWYRREDPLAGATGAVLTLAAAVPGDAGDYRCVVGNPYGTVTSRVATLGVNTPVTLLGNPQSLVTPPAMPAHFAVIAAGTPPLHYRWQKDGVSIAGATGRTFAVASVTDADAGLYRCLVSNRVNTATSDVARLTLAVTGSELPSANVRYVAQAGQTPVYPYTAWANAASSINHAVTGATNGTLVLVANGAYRLESPLVITSSLTLRSHRNGALDRAATLIDGDFPRATNRCILLNAVGAVVEGFTIVNGRVEGDGGGVCILAGTLKNCLVTGNLATNGSGGGVYATGTNSLIDDCDIVSNACWYAANAAQGGGGVRLAKGAPLRNSRIMRNRCPLYASAGGGVNAGGDSEIVNCAIIGNTVEDGYGGGGVWVNGRNIVLRNCLVAGNGSGRLAGTGAGVGAYGGSALIENCTIVSNRGHGIGANNPSTYHALNTIAFFNDGEAMLPGTSGGILVASNCCVSSTARITGGSGNNTSPPHFVNAGAGDYRLAPGSPGVDAGLNLEWMGGATDLDGAPRLDGLTRQVDVGCYEAPRSGALLMLR